MLEGHQAEIISYSLQYPNFLFPGSSQFEQSGAAPADITVHTLISTINPLSWWRTARFIKAQKPDFILFRYWLPFFGPALGTIGRLVKRQTVVLALTDNVLPHEKRPGDVQFTRYFIKSCHGFIAMSRKVLTDIGKFSNTTNTVYAPHPMYETYGEPVSKAEARNKLRLAQGDKIVLFFGLVRHYKGLDLLIEAMADPELKKSGVRLLIAGEFYEDKKPYLELIDRLGMQDRVLLHDRFIANGEVRYYFCAADLVAQTYRDATNSGVTMVGYYYTRPMLVTNVGGLSEIVPDRKCGYVVERDPAVIANCIADFFEQGREKKFLPYLEEERKKYTWQAFVRSLTGLYEGVRSSNNKT